MTLGIYWGVVLVLLIALAVLAGIPTVLLVCGFKRFRIDHSLGARVMIGIGAGIFLIYLSAIAAHIISVGPYRSGIVSHGKSPEGLEYCIVQTYKTLGIVGEPYQVSFYIRDTSGLWRWNYLAHQDDAWRSATVNFTNGDIQVYRNGVDLRIIPMPTGTVEVATVLPGYKHQYIPAECSAEDISENHNKSYK